jgi:hypothetical protein|tara:strand:- start:1650 stop:1823 length:174 start_codon:yes stop_codon:yes gene_type:complete
MIKISIQYLTDQKRWVHYQTKHNEVDAYKTAKGRAVSTKRRHRLIDSSGRLLDLVEP